MPRSIHDLLCRQNINIFRDPRWGRGQETQGEDPTLNAAYASNFPLGFQGGEDPKHLKASCCLKHYAVSGWHGTDGRRTGFLT